MAQIQLKNAFSTKCKLLENVIEKMQCFGCKDVPGPNQINRYSCTNMAHSLCEKCKIVCPCTSSVGKCPLPVIHQLVNELPWHCPNFKLGCREIFSDAKVLNDHQEVCIYQENTQTDQNSYICKICEKNFAGPGTLEIHQRIHGNQEELVEDKHSQNVKNAFVKLKRCDKASDMILDQVQKSRQTTINNDFPNVWSKREERLRRRETSRGDGFPDISFPEINDMTIEPHENDSDFITAQRAMVILNKNILPLKNFFKIHF